MNNLYFALALFGFGQFFGLTEKTNNFQPGNFQKKESHILKDSFPGACVQKSVYENWLAENPAFQQKQNRLEAEQKVRIENGQTTARRGTAYEIPVVVHIIHNNGSENISDARVTQGIQFLNEAYANSGAYAGTGGLDTELSFRLASVDPDNMPTNGINRVISPFTFLNTTNDFEMKQLSRWDPTCYVNIYIVGSICVPVIGCGVAGYAYLPTAHGNPVDGVVLEASFMGTNRDDAVVLAHEFGHYLGLYHTFEGGCKNDDCLSDGDRVCDTPPDQSIARVDCADGANSCFTDVNPSDGNNPFSTDQNDQMENFMDYASCSVIFTEGQRVRMIDALENIRFSLIDPDGCAVLCDDPVTANFSVSSNSVLAGETVTFTNLSNGAVVSEWSVDGVPFTGNQYTFNEVGNFQVELRIIGANPICQDIFKINIKVSCPVRADFAASNTQAGLNETITFSNQSTAAIDYEWSVDGAVVSTDPDFDFSSPTPNIYNICLTAKNDNCEAKKCLKVLVNGRGNNNGGNTGNENCLNGIDDDGDGLVDFYDPDCICVQDASCTAPYYQTCTDDCLSDTPFTNFSAIKKQSDIQIYWTSMLAANDFDGDCKTDILAITQGNDLSIIDPVTQTIKYQIIESAMGNFTTGDVDGDGMAEIFVNEIDPDDSQIYRLSRYEFEPSMNSLVLTWRSTQPIRFLSDDFVKLNAAPMLADFNGDGRPEVNIGNQIYDSQTGIELVFMGDNFNRGSARGGMRNRTEGIKATAIAADFLPDNVCTNCSGLELAAGNQVFAVNINSYTNPSLNSMEVAVALPGFQDGVTSFADFDMDGDLDLIIGNYSSDANTDDMRLYIWDAQTPTLIGSPLLFPRTGLLRVLPPSIGDLDGDGKPEIVFNTGEFFILEDYQTGGGANWGNDLNQTIFKSMDSGDHSVGVSLFDFNLDGKQEILIRNNSGLNVFDKNLNSLFFDSDNASTEYEFAIVADIDDDQQAEIITYLCPGGAGPWNFVCGRFTTFESAAEPWANTRKVWNQYSFLNTNINEDGSIPSNQQQGQLVTPALNSFNQQYAIPETDTDCNAEICNNGIDDDGDGLVDFFDDDCPCLTSRSCGTPFYTPCIENCNDPQLSGNYQFEIDYPGTDLYQFTMLVAADIDGDCEPEVCGIDRISGTFNGVLRVTGQNGLENTYQTNGVLLYDFATADVDNDGVAEIFVTSQAPGLGSPLNIIRLDFNPSNNQLERTWISSQPIDVEGEQFSFYKFYPSIADFNGDGIDEIYVGNQIFDSETGQFLASPGAGFSMGSARNTLGERTGGFYTGIVAVDMLPDAACANCTGLELVAGNQIFSVNLTSRSNASTNTIAVEVELPGLPDGLTAVADYDLDGDLDAIVSTMDGGGSNPGRLYIWDGQTPIQMGQSITFDATLTYGSSVPAIGDLDGDGRPEIVINANEIISFEDYETGGQTNWGSIRNQTILGTNNLNDHQVGVVLFDFDFDGKQEVVTRNNDGLFILNEQMRQIGFQQLFNNSSTTETPLIIDWDDDQQAEIITTSCQAGPSSSACSHELTVISSASFAWSNTRKIQNQNTYFNTNLNDDGTVPLQQQNPHLVDDVALNSFKQQYAMPAAIGAEASAKIKNAPCGKNGIEVEFEICNEGEETLPATTPVTIYGGDPTQTNAPIYATFELPDDLFAGECVLLKKLIPSENDSVFVVVNDDGTLTRPFNLGGSFPPTGFKECDYLNNISGFEIPFSNPDPLDLGPDQTVCDNGVFPLDAGEFDRYRWFDGSTERSVTVFDPGRYWVEVTDICGTVQSDTIVIEIDPISEVKLGTDLTVCSGDTVRFDAGIFDEYKWLPKPAADCDTCQVFELEISQDTQIIVQVASDLGCFSTDTIDVFIGVAAVGLDSISICRGDTISVNGTRVFSDTLLSRRVNSIAGCDSILNTKIIVNDSIFIKEKIEICAGDTAFVFGNAVTESDTLIQIFGRTNGCDSTRRVEVSVQQQLFSDDEIQACEGDTLIIFGNEITESDTLSRVFTSAIGCDSTSEIRVVFRQSINTGDDLDLCAGDTAMVFGSAITSDSILFETYNSLSGCDSTHEIQVRFRPAISSSEILTFCEGDTAMIFGDMITESDTISEFLTAANGCDSLATVEVIFNQKSISSDVFEYCEGDTARMFGLEIMSDTTVSETLQNISGCDSTYTAEFIFNQKFQTADDLQFCTGDTAMIFGNRITENDTLSQVFTSSLGCDSTSEIRVVFTNSIQTSDDLDVCAGDTVMVFGNAITSDSILFENYNSVNGCDSTHEVRVAFRPAISGGEMLIFCEGDTAMIFGNMVTKSDTISEILTAENGCDSLTTIEIVFNQNSISNEVLELCEGDTARVFGLEIMNDTTVLETTQNFIGCDSVHTIEIIFNSKNESNETLTFCEGDTARVFGLAITSDTIVSETFPTFNGCDSTNTFEIIFNQKFESFEQLEFCVGDTAFLFGNALTVDDTVFQVFPSAIGCDSTHYIDVVFLAEAEKMIFDSLCTGDILLFFNDTISETGTYFQTVPSIAGSCDTNYVLTAEFFNDPIVSLIADTIISVGEVFEIPLNLSDPNLQITWSPSENLSCDNCSNPTVLLREATTFEATITNERGCSVIVRINIRVIDDNGIYIPNTFSPNGDSNNDFFTAFAKTGFDIDQLQIFDRWGGLLFELNGFVGNDASIGWDGMARGMPVGQGVYVYKFLISNSFGEQEIYAGDVTVLR